MRFVYPFHQNIIAVTMNKVCSASISREIFKSKPEIDP